MKEKLLALGVLGVMSSLQATLSTCNSVSKFAHEQNDTTLVNQKVQFISSENKKAQKTKPLLPILVIGTVGFALVLNRSNGKKEKNTISRLRKKLIYLVGGDINTAERLFNNIKYKYPDRDDLWCWEKVIFDLERDRG